MDTKISIPGLLPSQVACCCGAFHYLILKARTGDGGIESRYVCPVTFPLNFILNMVMDCSRTSILYVLSLNLVQYYWFIFAAISKKYSKQIPFMICLHDPKTSCNHGNLVIYHMMIMAWYN